MRVARSRRRLGPAAVAVAAVAALTALTACGGNGGSAGGSSSGSSSGKKITFAFRSDDKPVSFIDGGKPTGFMIELTQAMAKRMGMTPTYVATDFASMVPGVRNHTYDSAAFATLVTDARKKVADFTTPVTYSQAQLISRKKDPIASISQADGKTVAITRGSELIPILQKLEPGVRIKEFPNVAASANALTAGQVNGLFTGLSTTDSLLGKHSDFTATQAITSGMSAFPVAKDRQDLKKKLDDALAAVIADGTYTSLFDKWNPPGVLIPAAMLHDYPGMKQRPQTTATAS